MSLPERTPRKQKKGGNGHLRACVPACLPACQPALLPACLRVCQRTKMCLPYLLLRLKTNSVAVTCFSTWNDSCLPLFVLFPHTKKSYRVSGKSLQIRGRSTCVLWLNDGERSKLFGNQPTFLGTPEVIVEADYLKVAH